MALTGDSASAQNRALAETGHVDLASEPRASITGTRETSCNYTDVNQSARQFTEDSASRDLASNKRNASDRISYDRSTRRR